MHRSRRQFLAQLMLASAIPHLVGCQQTSTPVTVGCNNFVAYRFFDLAKERGLYAPTDIRLLEHPSATHVAQSLATGTIDAGLLTLDELMRLWERGHAIDLVAIVDISAGIDVVLARPPIKSVDQIKGKRIAVEVGAVGSIMLSKLLSVAGLSSNDVDIVYANVSQHIDLYQTGSVDLVVSFSPVSMRLQQLGALPIFSSRDFEPMIVDVVAVSRRLYEVHRKTLKKMLSGFFQVVDEFNQQPSQFHARLAALSHLSEVDVIESLAGLQMQSREQNRQWLARDNNRLQNIVELVGANSKISVVDIRPFTNAEFVQ